MHEFISGLNELPNLVVTVIAVIFVMFMLKLSKKIVTAGIVIGIAIILLKALGVY